MEKIGELARIFYGKLSPLKTMMVHDVGNVEKCGISKEKFASFTEDFSKFLIKSSGKRIELTFDDGHESLYTEAYPILKKYGIKFTAFLVSDFIDRPNYLSENEIKEMLSSGLLVIGAHGKTHRILTSLNPEETTCEICDCKQVLESRFRVSVTKYAYSHGQYTDYSLEILRNNGFYEAYMAQYSFWGGNKYLKPRMNLCDQQYQYISSFLRKSGY